MRESQLFAVISDCLSVHLWEVDKVLGVLFFMSTNSAIIIDMLDEIKFFLGLKATLKRRGNESSVIVMAAQDSDTSISLITVKNILDSEGSSYSVVLISSFQQLQRQLQSLETQPITVNSVIVLNCGSFWDIYDICKFQQNVDCYVYDYKRIFHKDDLIEGSQEALGRPLESERQAVGTLCRSEEDSAVESKSLKRGREGEVEHSPKRIKRDDSQEFRTGLTVRDSTLITEPVSDLNPRETQDKVELDWCKFEKVLRYLTYHSEKPEELDRDELMNWFLSVFKYLDIATVVEAFTISMHDLFGRPKGSRINYLWNSVIDVLAARGSGLLEAAKALTEMGESYLYVCYREPAKDYFETALKIYKKNFPDAIERANAAKTLADNHLFLENWRLYKGSESKKLEAKIEKLYLEALRIYRKVTPYSSDTAKVLKSLGSLYLISGRYDKAELLLMAASETRSLSEDDQADAFRDLRRVYHRRF